MRTNYLLIVLVILGTLLLPGCNPAYRVGELQNQHRFVDVGDAQSVSVDVDFGAGNLEMIGGGERLLDADFTYNVARLKPEVEYTQGSLVVRQPEIKGLPDLRGITDFRNEWDLRLNGEIPMDLSVDVGAGISNLQLADLSLTGLDVNLGFGASGSTIDLSGNWRHDLDVEIDSGAADLTVRLPNNIGARVKVSEGPNLVNTTGLTRDGEFYVNAAYGVSEVTLRIDLDSGVGLINLEVVEKAASMTDWPLGRGGLSCS